MADQGDQLMRQSPLNRPAICCCWYGGVVFTAFITSTLRITVQGIVMVLRMIMIIELAIDGTTLSPSLLVMFVVFVKLVNEKFTMSNWNLSAR